MAKHLIIQFFLPEENRFYDILAKLGKELARQGVDMVFFTESKSERIRGFRNVCHDHCLTRKPLEDVEVPEAAGDPRDTEALRTQSCFGLSADPENARGLREFWTEWIEELRPIGILVAEQNIPASQVLVECCREKRLPYWHLSKGVFDNTIQIDPCGHLRYGSMIMSPTLCSQFKEIKFPYSFQQIADFFLSANQSHYPDINRERPPEYLVQKDERPVVLILGAGNVTTLTWPGQASKISPIFRHSHEMVDWFLEHYQDMPRDCRFVFKNHPWDIHDYRYLADHNFEWVPRVDVRELVNLADIVVSISTIVQFECILMRKPQVIIGNSELSGKGVAYVANAPEEILPAVSSCLMRQGFDEKQERAEAFVERLCNLFLVGTSEEMPCGLDLKALAGFLVQFKEMVWNSGVNGLSPLGSFDDRADPEFEIRRLQKRLENAERQCSEASKECEKLEKHLGKMERNARSLNEKLTNQQERIEQWNRKSFIHRVFHRFRW